MFSKFFKVSLCISAASSLAPSNPFSSTSTVCADSKTNEKKRVKLTQLLAERGRLAELQAKAFKARQEALKKEPRHFFEKTVLESLGKIALYQLVGFLGYLPYISTVGNYLMIPLIPINFVLDSCLLYMYSKDSKEFKVQEKTWSSKEFCKAVDYMSYAFGFMSAGGVARGVPAFAGMIFSMYMYALASKGNFNRNYAVVAGAVGATVPMFILSHTLTFWIGKHKRLPFTLGILLSYGVLSALMCRLMDDYRESKNEDKIPSVILSTYKWSYLNLLVLWTLFGSE